MLHQPLGYDPEEAPHTLILEYKMKPHTRGVHHGEDHCPVLDIHVIVEPVVTARSSIMCSDEELIKANQGRQTSFTFSASSRFERQQVVLRSDDLTLFKHAGEDTLNFAILTYDLTVHQSGNALSVVATYPFSSVAMAMSLLDANGSIIQLERSAGLEGDNPRGVSHVYDKTTFVEVPSIDKGEYTLEVVLPRALFLASAHEPTCIGFDLAVEYVTRSHAPQDADKYEILSVRPLELNQISPNEDTIIELDFDKDVVLDDLVHGLADRFYVCQLVYNGDSSNKIHPKTVELAGSHTLRLEFAFGSASIPSGSPCYHLACSTQSTKGHEYIRPMQEQTSYCFDTTGEHDPLAHCNPLAHPKLHKDGSCICSSPYKGHDCEECIDGYIQQKSEVPYGRGKTKSHTMCVLDHDHVTEAACNGHGRPKTHRVSHISEVECDCDQGFGGKYCDYCLDPAFAYPACEASQSSLMYDSDATHAFLSRRRYEESGYTMAVERYFEDDSLEPTIFNEECAWVDFPDDLERVEHMGQFEHGEFHIADTYVVNHKQDNVMRLKPASPGTLKVLL